MFNRIKCVKSKRTLPSWDPTPTIVEGLLLVVDTVVPRHVILRWDREQLRAAGDWAFRVHLRASDNLWCRVPEKPAHVAAAEIPRKGYGDSGTVFDVVAGERH